MMNHVLWAELEFDFLSSSLAPSPVASLILLFASSSSPIGTSGHVVLSSTPPCSSIRLFVVIVGRQLVPLVPPPVELDLPLSSPTLLLDALVPQNGPRRREGDPGRANQGQGDARDATAPEHSDEERVRDPGR